MSGFHPVSSHYLGGVIYWRRTSQKVESVLKLNSSLEIVNMSAHCQFIIGFLLLLMGTAPFSQQVSNEYQLKAAFIYRLAQMVEWPENSVPSTLPLTFCFIGQDSFGTSIDPIKEKTIRNRPLVFKKGVALDKIEQCHLLFVEPSEIERLSSILTAVGNLPILTIGDVEEFTRQGGMINLLKISSKIQIEVNLKSVKRAKLTISSRLLAIAKVIE